MALKKDFFFDPNRFENACSQINSFNDMCFFRFFMQFVSMLNATEFLNYAKEPQ